MSRPDREVDEVDQVDFDTQLGPISGVLAAVWPSEPTSNPAGPYSGRAAPGWLEENTLRLDARVSLVHLAHLRRGFPEAMTLARCQAGRAR